MTRIRQLSQEISLLGIRIIRHRDIAGQMKNQSGMMPGETDFKFRKIGATYNNRKMVFKVKYILGANERNVQIDTHSSSVAAEL